MKICEMYSPHLRISIASYTTQFGPFLTGVEVWHFNKKKWLQIPKNFMLEVNQLKILRFENRMRFTSSLPKNGSIRNNDVKAKNRKLTTVLILEIIWARSFSLIALDSALSTMDAQ